MVLLPTYGPSWSTPRERQVFTTSDDRSAALALWLDFYDTRRRHCAVGGQHPPSALTVINVSAEGNKDGS